MSHPTVQSHGEAEIGSNGTAAQPLNGSTAQRKMYLELHAATSFSFLEGASLPEDLVAEASRLGYSALAVCDRDGVYGAPRFHKAALAAGMRPLVGCEISLDAVGTGTLAGQSRDRQGVVDRNNGKSAHGLRFMGHESQPLPDGRGSKTGRGSRTNHAPDRFTVLVENRRGYQNLCRLLTRMHLRSPKGEGRATWNDLEEYAGGLVALTPDLPHAGPLQAIFGPKNLYIEIQRHFPARAGASPTNAASNMPAVTACRFWPPTVSATPKNRNERYSTFSPASGKKQFSTAQAACWTPMPNAISNLPAEMARLFRDLPDAVLNTKELAARLDFTLKDLGYEFPHYPVPPGETEMSYLRQVTEQGARERYRPYHERAQRQIEHELRVIEKLKLPGYFLNRLGNDPLLPRKQNPGARTRFGGQQRGLLQPGDHGRRPGRHGAAVRALSFRRTRRVARHRH